VGIRRSLYLVAALMTLVPLLFLVAYENSFIKSRLVADRKAEFVDFADNHGELLMRTSQNAYAQIWLATRQTLTKNLREMLETPEGVITISLQLNDAENSIGSLDTGVKKVSDMMIVDINGEILVSGTDRLIGVNISGTPLFDLLLNQSSAVSPFVESQFNAGAYGLWLTRGLGDGLFFSSFVAADVYSLNYLSFGKTGHYMLINTDGVIITHPNPNYIGTVVDNPDITSALSEFAGGSRIQRSGSGTGKISGVEQIYGYYILSEFGGAICLVQHTDEAINSIFPRRDVYIAVLLALVTLLIFMPLLHFRIISPIMKLKECINLASTGQYQICEVKHDDEIGALVRGFNHLADQICERIGELELKNRALLVLETELKNDKERLKVSEQRFKFAVDISTIAIFELTPYTNTFFASNSWNQITTYDLRDSAVYPLDYVMNTIIHPDYREKVINWLDQMTGYYDEDIRIFTSNGSGKTKWLHVTMAIVEDEDTGKKKISGTLTDINERMIAQEFSDYIAHHEALTGFPRRNMFCSAVSQKLSEIKDGYWGAVIILNIANMRRINDTFGFTIGDKVILIMAEALKKAFGKEMYYSRNSGDSSFLLYVECEHDVDHLDKLSARIQELFRKPLLIQNMSIMAEIRMGAALYPLHGYAIDELIQYADIAMIEAWYVKKTYFALFERNMVAKIRRTHQIMQMLQDIDEVKSLYLVYQPIINIDRKCIGFEALARLNITSMGFISPAEFIPLAENARIIISMGKELLQMACSKAKELAQAGFDFEYISVNVSPVQLDDEGFVKMVFNVLKETGLPPEKLQLEVTESVMLSNVDTICEKLRVFRDGGITIALDDFGTGYSSMKYLRTIPLDVLKIDKHFIDEIENDKQQVFAFMMIQMAHKLGLKVVAEGVETKMQFDILKERECDCIQGYYISRPLSEDALEEFMKEH